MVVQSVSQPSPALEHDPSGIEKLSNSASSRTMESYSVIVSPVIMSSPESNRKLNLMLSTSWKEKGTDVCLFLFSITLFSMDKWAFKLAKFWSSYIEVQPTHLKPTYICVCWSTDVGTAECSCMIYILIMNKEHECFTVYTHILLQTGSNSSWSDFWMSSQSSKGKRQGDAHHECKAFGNNLI